MSKVVIDDIHLTNIANSIRTKASNETKLTPAEMSVAIDNIKSGGGGADIIPFTSVERKTWIPQSDTLYYQVEKTENLAMIVMICKGSGVGRSGIHSLICITDNDLKIEQYGYPVGAWSGMAYGCTSGLATYNYPSAGQIGDDGGTTMFATGEEYTILLFYK